MQLISANVIKQIGYQIEPSEDSLSKIQRALFQQVIADITTKELEAVKITAKVEEMKVIATLVEASCYDTEKSKLVERYLKLAKELE